MLCRVPLANSIPMNFLFDALTIFMNPIERRYHMNMKYQYNTFVWNCKQRQTNRKCDMSSNSYREFASNHKWQHIETFGHFTACRCVHFQRIKYLIVLLSTSPPPSTHVFIHFFSPAEIHTFFTVSKKNFPEINNVDSTCLKQKSSFGNVRCYKRKTVCAHQLTYWHLKANGNSFWLAR